MYLWAITYLIHPTWSLLYRTCWSLLNESDFVQRSLGPIDCSNLLLFLCRRTRCFLMLLLQCCFWSEWTLGYLDNLSGGISLSPASMLSPLFATVYRLVSLACFLLSHSNGNFSCCSMVLLLKCDGTFLLSNICWPSLYHLYSFCLSFCVWGSHIELAYSTVGLTYAVNDFIVFTICYVKIHSVLLAPWYMLFTYVLLNTPL